MVIVLIGRKHHLLFPHRDSNEAEKSPEEESCLKILLNIVDWNLASHHLALFFIYSEVSVQTKQTVV